MNKIYVVRRWLIGEEAPHVCREQHPEDHRIAGVFAELASAEECFHRCERRSRLTRREQSLFDAGRWGTFIPLTALTDFDPPVFFDWLQDASIPPPKQTRASDWLEWWYENCESLTDPQRQHLFEGLHRFTFHEILELDCREEDDSLLDEVFPGLTFSSPPYWAHGRSIRASTEGVTPYDAMDDIPF